MFLIVYTLTIYRVILDVLKRDLGIRGKFFAPKIDVWCR